MTFGAEVSRETSHYNVSEADTIADVVQELSDIVDSFLPDCRVILAVIAMYSSQVKVIEDALKSVTLSPFLDLVGVQTVDSFQGRAADHVIVSTVRTSRPGFLSVAERANVAVTRARFGLLVEGSVPVLRSGGPVCESLTDTAERLKRAGTVDKIHGDTSGRTWKQALDGGWQWTLAGWDSEGRTFSGHNSYRG